MNVTVSRPLTQRQREIISDLEEMHEDREDITADELQRAIRFVQDNPDKYVGWESTWDAADDVLSRS